MDYLEIHELYHHGTKGMKWGRRLYQNEDGTLTPLGRIHYGYISGGRGIYWHDKARRVVKKYATDDDLNTARRAASIIDKKLDAAAKRLNKKTDQVGLSAMSEIDREEFKANNKLRKEIAKNIVDTYSANRLFPMSSKTEKSLELYVRSQLHVKIIDEIDNERRSQGDFDGYYISKKR